MPSLRSLWFRARAILDRRRVRDEIDTELAFHLEMATAGYVAQGVALDEARLRARRDLGEPALLRDECIDERGARRVDEIAQDLRFAIRTLRRNPAFAAVAITTVALGIGAATTVFSVVDGVLLKPLPYAESDRLVILRQRSIATGAFDDVAPANFLDWRERSRTLERMSAAVPYSMDYLTPDGALELEMWLVSEDFFPLLGTPARMGRTFHAGEFTDGTDRVVVLGDRAWREQFGGDSAIVGRSLVLDGKPFTVIGVMPPEFRMPSGRNAWVPLTTSEEDRQIRGSAWWTALGRQKPGVGLAAARGEMEAIGIALGRENPETNSDVTIDVTPLREALLGPTKPALALLSGAAVLLLLISCANVANLLLARAVKREREFGIRAALGAGRSRIARQLVTEALVLAISGGILGITLARWGVDVVKLLSPADIPRIDQLAVDGRALAFALFVSTVVAIGFGLAPTARASRRDLQTSLKEGGRTSSGRRTRALRSALAAAQVMLATTLLVGAALLVRSFVTLMGVDRGYRTENVLTLTVQASSYYRDPAARAEFVRQALDRLGSLPGVSAAGVTSSLPLAPAIGASSAEYAIEGRPLSSGAQRPSVHAAVIAGDYFRALGVPLLRGRWLNPDDRVGTLPVALVNSSFARAQWPGENAVGKRLAVRLMGADTTREVVGVVGDMRHEGLHVEPKPSVFLPHGQVRTGALWFTVRTTGNPMGLARATRAELAAMNASMPVEELTTLDALLQESVQARRFHLVLIAAFSLAALVLAAIGVYGVVSGAMAERTHEIGIRMALGARAADVIGLVVRQGMLPALAGLALGVIAAALLSRFLSTMLFATAPLDAGTYAEVTLLTALVALLATLVPAARAARIPPTEALAGE